MIPLDLRYFRAHDHDDEGGGVIVWLAIAAAFWFGMIVGAM